MAEEEQLDIFRNLPSLSSTCFAGRITKQFPSISVADAKGNYLSKTKKCCWSLYLGSAWRCKCCLTYQRKWCWGRNRGAHKARSCQHCKHKAWSWFLLCTSCLLPFTEYYNQNVGWWVVLLGVTIFRHAVQVSKFSFLQHTFSILSILSIALIFTHWDSQRRVHLNDWVVLGLSAIRLFNKLTEDFILQLSMCQADLQCCLGEWHVVINRRCFHGDIDEQLTGL